MMGLTSRKMKLTRFGVVCVFAALFDIGATATARSETLKPSAQGQVENLMAIILVTTEPSDSVRDRWNTAREVTPSFVTSPTVSIGETVNFVGLYAGAGRGADGNVLLACDVTIFFDDQDPQSILLDPCVQEKPEGPPTDVYMTNGFSIAVKEELAGKTIRIEAKVTDTGSGATVPLVIAFQVLPDSAGAP